MKKKILVLAFMIMAISIMITIPVYAGKGQEKLDFELFITGEATAPERIWTKGGIMHLKGLGFVTTGDYYVMVDGEKYYPIDYTASINYEVNTKTGQVLIHIKETIIFDDGTIEITVKDSGPMGGPFSGTFVGIGKGSLQGVKVHGTTEGPPGTFNRSGIVMGWPTAP